MEKQSYCFSYHCYKYFLYSASNNKSTQNQLATAPSEVDSSYTTLKVCAYKDQNGAVLLSPVKRNATDKFSFIRILSDGKTMKKCGKLYDEILKSKSVASRSFDHSYMKTLDVIRRSNLSERKRWVRDLKIKTNKNDPMSNKPEIVDSNPSTEIPSKSQKKQDTRNNTNKTKEEIQRKSLQTHIKKQKDINKQGRCSYSL